MEVAENRAPSLNLFGGQGMETLELNLKEALGGMFQQRSRRKMTVRQARAVLEAEEMEVVSGLQVVPSESGVWFAANGTIAGQVQVPVAGRHTVRVLAGGTPLGGVYPEFEVALDGEALGRRSVDSESAGYHEITADLVPGERTLSLSFVNDAWEPPEDRNLFVDRITVVRR